MAVVIIVHSWSMQFSVGLYIVFVDFVSIAFKTKFYYLYLRTFLFDNNFGSVILLLNTPMTKRNI